MPKGVVREYEDIEHQLCNLIRKHRSHREKVAKLMETRSLAIEDPRNSSPLSRDRVVTMMAQEEHLRSNMEVMAVVIRVLRWVCHDSEDIEI